MDYATMPSLSSNQSFAGKWLTPEFYDRLHSYWFKGYPPDALSPSAQMVKTWFMRDEMNDEYCRNTYVSVLEAIKSAQPTAEDLINPEENPLHAIDLLLLLDQISRNTFRGPESKVVFNTYDPLALDISLRAVFPRTYQAAASVREARRRAALDAGTDTPDKTDKPWYEAEEVMLDEGDKNGGGLDELPEFRHHLGYRMWFYSPLMHSESVKVHRWAEARYKAMIDEMDALSKQSSSEDKSTDLPRESVSKPEPLPLQKPQDDKKSPQQELEEKEEENPAEAFTSSNPYDASGAKLFAGKLLSFETQHREIIERFGRYPHRNKALGRPSTEEEVHYLENGGLTFAS